MPILPRNLIRAEVGARNLKISRADKESEFVTAPLVAVEDLDGRLVVRAVGDDANALAIIPGHRIINPFETVEPLLSQMDFACALFAYYLRELSTGFHLTSPVLELQLIERFTPLSENDKNRCSEFAYRIGVRELKLLLGDYAVPDLANAEHSKVRSYLIAPKKPSQRIL